MIAVSLVEEAQDQGAWRPCGRRLSSACHGPTFLHTGHMSHALPATWHCAHLPSLGAVSAEARDLGEMGQPLFTVKPKEDKQLHHLFRPTF